MATFATSGDIEKINMSIFRYVPKLIACHLKNRMMSENKQRRGLKPTQNSRLFLKEGKQMKTKRSRSSNDKWIDATYRKIQR